jgi:K+ transporter
MNALAFKVRQWLGPLVIAVLICAVLSMFILIWQQRQENLLEQQDLENRLARIANTTPTTNPSAALQRAVFFHEGQTSEIVAAHILTDLKLAATSQSVEILRSGNLPLDENNGTRSTRVFLEVSGLETAVYRFLRQIELSQPLLLVTKLHIRSNGTLGTEETIEQPLTVEMTLNAAMMPVSE